jgi:two-component system sensor histidine kinase UhpB
MIRLQEGLKVLLIENIPKDKDAFLHLLKECRIELAEFVFVENYDSALVQIQNSKPDIIFSGILTDENSANDDALQKLRTHTNVPFITLSPNEDEEKTFYSILLSSDDHLFKNELSAPFLKKSIQYCLERNKKDAELKEIIERFDLLAKATNDIVWDWELTKRRSVWMGNGLQTNLGYSRRMLSVDADFWEKGLHPEDFKRVMDKLETIFKDARVNKWEDEYRFKTISGDYRVFYDRGYIIYDNGKPVRMIGTMEDITERILLEKKLELETLLKQKQIAEAVVTAQENERTEIGKELHDNVNQLLSASKLYIDAAANDIANNELLLTQASGYIKNAIEEIRALSKVLHAPLIYELGLCESINNLTDDIMIVNDLQIHTDYSHFTEEKLNENFKLTIYRIIQEQLTNILKHSRASEANISLLSKENDIYLEVSDNGIGFDTSRKRQGIGLSNIQSRVSMYEGSLELYSQPDKGSKLSVKFPLNETVLSV